MSVAGPPSRDKLVKTLGEFIGTGEASKEIDRVYSTLGIDARSPLSSEDFEKIREALEKSLGREVGGAMARVMTTGRLEIKPEDVGRFYESFHRMRNQLLNRQRRADNLNEELARLKELYENVSLSIPIGLCSVDMNFVITTWNREMEALTGRMASDTVGAKVPDILREYEPMMVKAIQLREVVRENRFPAAGRDGRKRIENLTLSPLVDRYDVLRGLVILVQDITDHVEMERNILQAEKLASVGRLAAGVAHEVGNPLTSIYALVQELMGEDGENKKFRNESLTLVAQHIGRINNIVNSLVEYSRQKSVKFTPSSVKEIVDKATPLLKLDNRGQLIDIEIDIQEDLPPVLCDPDQIQQVLINLLLNAADAINGKGTVIVKAEKSSPSSVAISVKDHGQGMTGDVAKHAIAPFFTTKPVGKGAGLGLYVCYNILENHNSSLKIQSAPGKGARIEFELETA